DQLLQQEGRASVLAVRIEEITAELIAALGHKPSSAEQAEAEAKAAKAAWYESDQEISVECCADLVADRRHRLRARALRGAQMKNVNEMRKPSGVAAH